MGTLLASEEASCQRAESPFLRLHSTDVTFHTLRVIIIQLTHLALRGTRGYVCYFSPVTIRGSPKLFLLESDITRFLKILFPVCVDLHAVSISNGSSVHRQQYRSSQSVTSTLITGLIKQMFVVSVFRSPFSFSYPIFNFE